MTMIGYARVSTDGQKLEAQTDALRAAGCSIIKQEQASGIKARPVLARTLREIQAGDILVVVRLDRFARSLPHLLATVEALRVRGAHLRSLNDPVDTSSPQGMFTLQIMGAMAELERSLIVERVKAGLQAARIRGRIGGNPKLRDPGFQAILMAKRAEAFFEAASPDQLAPIIARMRPQRPWHEVMKAVDEAMPDAAPIGEQRIRRLAKLLVDRGGLDPAVMKRAPSDRGGRYRSVSSMKTVATIFTLNPKLTLREAAKMLEGVGAVTPSGKKKWHLSAICDLRQHAIEAGLLRSDEGSPLETTV
jgi:DNA invertase Pin-like site-specific DNA recombinase